MSKYTVIVDTRERKPWVFSPHEFSEGSVKQTLKTGDYTIVGYEHLICIERKANTNEVGINICEARFERELVRLNKFKHAFIILEFTADDVLQFPIGSGIPQYRWEKLKITGKFMMSKIIDYMVKYPNVKIIFAGTQGKRITESIFKKVMIDEGT